MKTGNTSIRIGTSGYSFKDWLGTFYPPRLSPSRMLHFYASVFDTVELNFTYYRMPVVRTIESINGRTPEHFRFFVKAHQSFTHGRDLAARDVFLDGLTPMRESGKLAGILFQFPQSFKNNYKNRAYLSKIADNFPEYSPSVEFRDRSWDSPPVYEFLEKNALSFVSVDEPQTSTLFPRKALATTDTGYVRFHSRNPDNWYKDSSKRYDYLYSENQLREWLPMIKEMTGKTRNIFVYFNNCHQGQAVRNARQIKALLESDGSPGNGTCQEGSDKPRR